MIVIALLSVVGIVLNNYRDRRSFLIWMVTNASWAVYDFRIGAVEQGLMFTVYFLLSIYGWVKWSNMRN